MQWDALDTSATFDLAAFRANSRQLWQFEHDDFSSLADELAAAFKNSTPPERGSNLVGRYCKVLGGARYARPPQREFSVLPEVGAGGPIGVESVAATLADIYARHCVNALLGQWSQTAEAQRSMVVAIDPVWDGRTAGRLRFQAFWPFEIGSPYFNDMSEEDIQRADRVELVVPMRVDVGGSTSTLHFGRRVYTPDEAWIQAPNDDTRKVPIFPAGIRHGLGYIPLAPLRLAPSMRKGIWFPPVNEPLLMTQIADAVGLSDCELIARMHCFPKDYLFGDNAQSAPRTWGVAPDGSIVLGEGVDVKRVESNPALDKYLLVLDAQKAGLATTSSLPHASLSQSSGITGDAKAVEMLGQVEERERREQQWRDFEGTLANLTAEMWNLLPGRALRLPAGRIRVKVDYEYPQPARNDLQGMQSFVLAWAAGLDSPVRRLMRSEGIDEAQATARQTADSAAFRAFRAMAGSMPGLDSIGTQLADGTGGTA